MGKFFVFFAGRMGKFFFSDGVGWRLYNVEGKHDKKFLFLISLPDHHQTRNRFRLTAWATLPPITPSPVSSSFFNCSLFPTSPAKKFAKRNFISHVQLGLHLHKSLFLNIPLHHLFLPIPRQASLGIGMK